MNTQEAIKELMSKAREITFGEDDNVYLSRNRTVELISQIDEPQKPIVPQVAIEYYYTYKDCSYSLGELLGDFYSQSAREEFPRLDELAMWLHDNDENTNRQRELALATLIVNGPSAVEVEQEKLYRVSIADNLVINDTLTKNKDSGIFSFSIGDDTESELFTKAELEGAGFGSVFDNDMFEVQEVE